MTKCPFCELELTLLGKCDTCDCKLYGKTIRFFENGYYVINPKEKVKQVKSKKDCDSFTDAVSNKKKVLSYSIMGKDYLPNL